jgi:phosphoserine aminotransferase
MMSERKHNFNAGPAALPLPVLKQVQRHLVDHRGLGLSVMEMSHRSPEFGEICDYAKQSIAALYDLPDTHEVMFLQGGASMQFAQVPLNLGTGAYINTGTWSTKAIKEARTVGEAFEVWSAKDGGFRGVPAADAAVDLPKAARYLHYTSNNTIYGTQWHYVPETDLALVSDMSSDFLSRPVDVSKYDVVYAGAQKNAGPSGVTILLIRKTVSRSFEGDPRTPLILRYPTQADKGSMYNTPNSFGIYVLGLVAEWVRGQGGLADMAEQNAARAAKLYAAIDEDPRFTGHAETESRSHMNVTFNMETPEAEAAFLETATAKGFLGLKGHRSVGGLRASIYNAVPDAAIDALIDLMRAS